MDMAVEAPFSKYKINTYIITAVVLIGFASYCVYDGYFNETFIEKHTKDGVPSSTLAFNQKAPPVLFLGGLVFSWLAFSSRKKKIVADESQITDGKKIVKFDSIGKIDKTYFESKGYFVITYTEAGGGSRQWKISDRNYENLGALLDHTVSKIS